MPTAGRITAAILFAGLAWYVSILVEPLLPDDRQAPNLAWMNALIGVYFGWRFGAGARGFRDGIAQGIGTAACVAVAALILHSGALVIRRSMRERNEGFGAALEDFAGMVAEFGIAAAHPTVLTAAIIGAAVIGVIAALAQRAWT